MTISDRIFCRLNQLDMSQKEFSEETGIIPSTISEWKKKKTNPSSDKIMLICNALRVTPEWLLSGDDSLGDDEPDYMVIDRESDIGMLVETYNSLDFESRNRILGYAEAFLAMKE